MYETPITIVGNVVNDPVHRQVGEQEVFKFRVASNSRRRVADGVWEQGDTLFVSVNCWGRLVSGTAASLVKGDPVIVVGNVYTSEYTDRDDIKRTSIEMRATSVGPDLARCIAKIDRSRKQTEQSSSELSGDGPDDVEDAAEGLPPAA
ncbi:single-stranded DNA-binding protein [Mycolicibacterium sediminis]|uniref:Single-stranded DNA-binding protein n=1 Tax=Mycolicibacterium sediminis TaxID=1286180 RepID=A0A7I7QYE7_9MYCO|nr:single-stranded DNA-binding protein [Mycolicibacterium sediminis]BBY30870.1 single-stranded DNA-binding protein [Mycolicibacterium sediminis]